MEVRSSERMRKEHITSFTQVFKDSHMEGKVTVFTWRIWRTGLSGVVFGNILIWFLSQYSQMRDELFKSNMVCSFILLLLLMTVQVLIPAPRYICSTPIRILS